MRKKKKRSLKLLSFFGIILSICITTVGYSAFNSHLKISGEALVKVDNNIAIINVNLSAVESEGYEQYNNNHTVKAINYYIGLPNADSSITYKIDVKNKTDKDYGIVQITGLPDNLTYELINYNLGEKLCTNAICNSGAVDELYLKIKYKPDGYDSSNVNFSGRLNIDFEYFYDVIYRNVAGSSSLKQKALKGTTFQEIIPIPENHKMKIIMNGVFLVKDNDYFYDNNTNQLTISNVTSNIVITIEELGTEFDLTGTGQDRPFSYLNTGYDINEKTFFLEADFSDVDITDANEGIISIGNNINTWEVGRGKPGGVNLHVYYPMVANTTGITIDLTYTTAELNLGYGKIQKTLNLPVTKLFRLAFNSNGLYINGEKLFDENGKTTNTTTTIPNPTAFLATYFNLWKTTTWDVDIGSTEGNNRSNAIYHEIKIYNNLLTDQELIEKTSIALEEIPVEEEITYDSISKVKIGNNPITDIVYPFQPNNNKFLLSSPNITDLNLNSLYVEMDVSSLKSGADLENLIGVGNSISEWTAVDSYNFYVFYPDSDGKVIIALLNSYDLNLWSQFKADISLIDDSIIRIVLCRNGIFINGEKWFDATGYMKTGLTVFGARGPSNQVISTMFEKFTNQDEDFTFMYGSMQGDNQSTATYNDIRIYYGVLSEQKAISLTS